MSKIGIGITTHNRPDAFNKTMLHMLAMLPEDAVICIVDDASSEDYYKSYAFQHGSHTRGILSYRFDSNVGIARAKNKALELLYDAGCEHFFLFDDDTYPLASNWYQPYIESGEPHLMYIFDTFANGAHAGDMIKYYQDDKISAYSHVRGCMLYYRRIVLDTVGGMDISFGKWGHEHGDLSNRIYAAGLTRFRYMDVVNSRGLFYATDEERPGSIKSTVPGVQRIDMLRNSQQIYDAHYNLPVYCEFREKKNEHRSASFPLFLTAYFTTLPDPQRPGHKWVFDRTVTDDYIDSIYKVNKLNGETVVLYDGNKLEGMNALYRTSKWINVETSINPYFQRWVSYYEYLIKHRDEITWVFMTDCTDVELLKVPEPEPGKIYVGDEPGKINNAWLTTHHKHPVLQKFFQTYRNSQMVNAGILGGYIDDVLPFVRAIIDTYVKMAHDERFKRTAGPGMTDMGVFNYVAYTQFANKISHGQHVNTVFKANERNDISWFKHK